MFILIGFNKKKQEEEESSKVKNNRPGRIAWHLPRVICHGGSLAGLTIGEVRPTQGSIADCSGPVQTCGKSVLSP